MCIQERLKTLRKRKGVTQKSIADTVSITEVSYQRYEYGKVRPEFNAVANVEFALRGITPEYCVRCALDGMARRKTVIVPNPMVAAGMTLGRFLPRPVYIKIAAHQQRKKLYKR